MANVSLNHMRLSEIVDGVYQLRVDQKQNKGKGSAHLTPLTSPRGVIITTYIELV